MALGNTRERYGLIAQILHWLTAVLILTLLVLGVYMEQLPFASEAEGSYKIWFYSLHKTLGVTVLFVAIVRIVWAFASPRPVLLNAENKLEAFAAETAHWVLYVAIIAMPVTGWVHHSALDGFAAIWWPFGQDLPFVPKNYAVAEFFGFLHWAFAIVLVLCLAAHIGGALKHFLIDKDQTLQRMIPGGIKDSVQVEQNPPGHGKPVLAAGALYAAVIGVAGMFGIDDHTAPGAAQADDEPIAAEFADEGGDDEDAWVIDHTQSGLKIVIDQSGSPTQGAFGQWSAKIVFDPDRLDSANVAVEVVMDSLSLGAVTDQAKGSDFLKVAEFATARFVASEFQRVGDNQYQVTGELTLLGVTRMVSFPFSLTIENEVAKMSASTKINRLDFGVGAAGFPNGDSVGTDVVIEVDIVANQ